MAEHRHFAAVVVQVGMHHDKGPRASGDEHAPSGLTSRIGTRAGAEMIVSAVSSAPARLVVSTLGSSAETGALGTISRCAGGKYLHLEPAPLHLLVPPRTAPRSRRRRRGSTRRPSRASAPTPRPRGLRRAHPGGGRPLQQRRLVASSKSVLDAQLEYPEREAVAGGYETVEERRGSPAPLRRSPPC